MPSFEEPDGFVIYECCTILRYLCETRDVASHWYPKHDVKMRALIDAYMDSHHLNVRLSCGGWFFRKFVSPAIGKPLPEALLTECDGIRKKVFKILERQLGKTSYLLTDDNPTLADLMAINEIKQYAVLTGFNFKKSYPKINAWMELMMKIPEVASMQATLDEFKDFVAPMMGKI